MTVKTSFVDLSLEECNEHLALAPLGRLGVVVDGRPEIFPVVHFFDPGTGSVVFPAGIGTKAHAALHWPYVAFEIDDLDRDGEGGWSVLVVGRAEEVLDPDDIERYRTLRRVDWAVGRTTTWLRIIAASTTGRRVNAVR